MSLYRETPPEYHALVVENELEFRRELVFTVESLDLGISVTGEAADYEDALELLRSQTFDLLLADINLTDQPQFRVGHRDGTALARLARDAYDIPTIFLTAFADSDPELITRASACDPIGFIHKQVGVIGRATENLIRLALRHLELVRSERETARQLRAVIRHIGDALIYVDGNDRVLDFDAAAAGLLGWQPEDMLDQCWEDILRTDRTGNDTEAALQQLLASRVGGRLPALALTRPDGAQLLVSLHVSPAEHLREQCNLVVLRDLHGEALAAPADQDAQPAMIVVFGISVVEEGPEVDATRLRIAMLALKAGLAARPRHSDVLGNPSPLTLALQLPMQDAGSALAEASTLLADMESLIRRESDHLRLHAGTAERDGAQTHIAALAAAIDALDRAQRSGESLHCGSPTPSVERAVYPATIPPPGSTSTARAFLFTDRLLEIAPGSVTDVGGLAERLRDCAAVFPRLRQVSLLRRGPDDRLEPLLHLGPDGAFDPAEPGGQPTRLMRRALRAIDLSTLPTLRMHPFGATAVFALALRREDRLCGMALFQLDSPHHPLRPVRTVESRIARIASEHLASIMEEIHACTARQATARAFDPDYNLHSVAGSREVVDEAAWLLRHDVAVAIVGETGLAKTELALHAAARAAPAGAAPPQIIDGSAFRDPHSRTALLRSLLQEDATRVIRHPQAMHASLQAELAAALQSRVVATAQGPCALPPAHTLFTLSRSPKDLAATGELAQGLASCLGAGVLQLPPLREEPALLEERARRILDAEAALQRCAGTRLGAGALQAIREHGWPGNLRELRERLRGAVRRAPRGELCALDLGLFRLAAISAGPPAATAQLPGQQPQLQRVRAALAPVVDIVCRLERAPILGHWLEDETVEITLQRFEADRDPLARSAEYLHLARRELTAVNRRAGLTAGDRQASPFWQSTRLALRACITEGAPFTRDFRLALRQCLLPLLEQRAGLSRKRAAEIAGLGATHYRDPAGGRGDAAPAGHDPS